MGRAAKNYRRDLISSKKIAPNNIPTLGNSIPKAPAAKATIPTGRKNKPSY